MREKEIETILREEVRRLGGKAYKWVSPGNDGVPDRIVIFPNQRPIFVELKSETGRLTRVQQSQIKKLQQLGQYVVVVIGVRGLAQFFRDSGYTETYNRLSRKYDLFEGDGDR